MTPRAKTALFATITVTGSILLCLLFIEYVAAHFLYADTQESIDKDFDSLLGWRYRPGTYRVKPDSSFSSHSVHINELGLRSRGQSNGSGSVRIVVLGDSFTFARQVPDEDMFTSRLETTLNETSPGTYEVVNAGVEGYGTAQQLLLMRKLAEAGVVGDLYVLQVFTNDILDNLRLDYESGSSTDPFRPGYALDGEGNLQLIHAPEREKWLAGTEARGGSLRTFGVLKGAAESYVQSRPALVRLAASLGISITFPRMPGLISGWYDEDVVRRGVPLMTELLRQIKAEAERQGARLLIVSIPSPLMVYPETYRPMLEGSFPGNPQVSAFVSDTARPARAVVEMAEQLEVPTLDLYPILLANSAKALYFPRDGHLQKVGHSIVAASLAEKMAVMDSGGRVSRFTDRHRSAFVHGPVVSKQ
jgi:hypothetical protein